MIRTKIENVQLKRCVKCSNIIYLHERSVEIEGLRYCNIETETREYFRLKHVEEMKRHRRKRSFLLSWIHKHYPIYYAQAERAFELER